MTENIFSTLKFAEFLANKGLLSPLVNSYKDFRSQQNYPYELKDRRLFKVACIKALCLRQDINIEDIENFADKMVKNLYGEEKVDKLVIDLMELHQIPEEFEKTVSFMMKTLNKEDFSVWIESASKGFQERKVAELTDPKQAKEIQDKKIDKDIKEQMNKETIVEAIEINMTTGELKEAVRKRVIRKKLIKK
jgi:hypothetical protein